MVLASREKKSASFSEYYANRIGEQKELQEELENDLSCPVGEWYQVASRYGYDVTRHWSRLCLATRTQLSLPEEGRLAPVTRDFAAQEELRGKFRDVPSHIIMAVQTRSSKAKSSMLREKCEKSEAEGILEKDLMEDSTTEDGDRGTLEGRDMVEDEGKVRVECKLSSKVTEVCKPKSGKSEEKYEPKSGKSEEKYESKS